MTRSVRRAALAAALLTSLAGCVGTLPSQQSTSTTSTAPTSAAAAVVSAYILAANGAVAYETANPSAKPLIRACDNVAWTAVKPVSDALAAGKDATAAAVTSATAAVAALTPCLTAAGVKP